MENHEVKYDRKYLNRIAWIYGIIVVIVNYVGFLLANSGGMPMPATQSYKGWIQFLTEYHGVTVVLSVLSFVAPAAIIIFLRITRSRQGREGIINLPFLYSAVSSLGWILSFALEFGCLLVAKYVYHIKIAEIAAVSFMHIFQECICIFTLSFFILDLLHRKVILPKLFPEGNLSKYHITAKPSVRFLVNMFYLSAGIFPIFYLTSSYITVIRNNNLEYRPVVFILLFFIIAMGLVILYTFCDYFTSPIRKLKEGTQKIKEGDYTHHVDIVSNDDFGELADAFNEMASTLEEKNQKIHAIQNSIIKGMAVMVESRDNSTGGHINRTSDCVRVFVEKLSMTEQYSEYGKDFWKALIKAAPMHDLGKIAVDDAVLRKPGRFTDEEYEIMKRHSSEGARIVEHVLSQVDDLSFKKIAINVAHYHHEKWNGTGYPEKIAKEEIPFEARVMALADVFDALVSKRCYKESFSYDKAFQIIEESLGTHFDPNLGQLFIECRPQLEKLYDSYE